MREKCIVLFLLLISCLLTQGQSLILPLYEGEVPNSKVPPAHYYEKLDSDGFVINITKPTLTAYFPDEQKENGSAVIIAPSGGYQVWVDEGGDMAKAFNKIGVTAFVLKYRMPSDLSMVDKSIGPLQDGQAALLLVRKRAAEWKIDPTKIGLVGISAGGHLSSTVATHFNHSVISNPTHVSLRPDFVVLLYPVISFQMDFVTRTRDNLIGSPSSDAVRDFFSNEKHVNAQTPPTWIIHAADDQRIPMKHSLAFFESLVKAGVKTELHILQSGGHGFALEHPTRYDRWFGACADWMKENGF